MAADLKEAIENFRSLSGGFQAMFELCEMVTPLADLKRATKEAESARDLAKTEHAKLCEKTNAERAKAANIAAGAEEHAATLVREATDEAAKLIEEAKARILADTKLLTQKATKAADEQDRRAQIASEAAAAAEEAVAAAKAEIADLEQRIAAARTQIASLLQG